MTTGGYLLSNMIGGAIAGSIGAGVSQGSDYPMLKGAIITSLISGAIAAVFIAGAEQKQLAGSLSDQLRSEWRL